MPPARLNSKHRGKGNILWELILDRMLSAILRRGALDLVMPDGQLYRYGNGGEPLTVHLHDAATVRHLVLNPEFALGEAYMNGTLTIDGDDVQALLGLIVRARQDAPGVWWHKLLSEVRRATRKFAQNNVVLRARRNVAHHYDLSGQLYDLFLDADQQYSCAYFRDPSDTLELAQAQKKEHIARKLMIEPSMRVLDIGCGWGGMALTLAGDHGPHVLGITLSKEQYARATARATHEGLSDLVEFRLCDYRDV